MQVGGQMWVWYLIEGLLSASIFSVKWETRLSAESEDEGGVVEDEKEGIK